MALSPKVSNGFVGASAGDGWAVTRSKRIQLETAFSAAGQAANFNKRLSTTRRSMERSWQQTRQVSVEVVSETVESLQASARESANPVWNRPLLTHFDGVQFLAAERRHRVARGASPWKEENS